MIPAPFVVVECEQNSPAWYEARRGRLTGSRASTATAEGKVRGTEAFTRRDYRIQLALERLTGQVLEDRFISWEMRWGKEHEGMARLAYEAATGNEVLQAGFCQHLSMMTGCSLDGMVEEGGRKGFIEIKCPKTATHLEYLESSRVPPEHMPQIIHNDWITGFDFADFVSWDPRMPKKGRLVIRRWERNEEHLRTYVASACAFLAEVTTTENRLRVYQ